VIDVLLVICLMCPALMLGLAIVYDARRRARNKANIGRRLDLAATQPSTERNA